MLAFANAPHNQAAALDAACEEARQEAVFSDVHTSAWDADLLSAGSASGSGLPASKT